MAAGAIPPPLFFERRHQVSLFAPRMASSENIRKYTSVDHVVETAGAFKPEHPRPITAEGI
jgi:hypothetical protein